MMLLSVLLAGCDSLKSEKHDRRVFREHRREFEELAAILRSCKGPTLFYPDDFEGLEPAYCGQVPAPEVKQRVRQLGLKSAGGYRREDGTEHIAFVTGSAGWLVTESETGIAWTNDYANIGPEEYEPLTAPPGVWWRFHW